VNPPSLASSQGGCSADSRPTTEGHDVVALTLAALALGVAARRRRSAQR
jgi:MYXO-CTERM domain-containing protein